MEFFGQVQWTPCGGRAGLIQGGDIDVWRIVGHQDWWSAHKIGQKKLTERLPLILRFNTVIDTAV
jgi:hypothetical protein